MQQFLIAPAAGRAIWPILLIPGFVLNSRSKSEADLHFAVLQLGYGDFGDHGGRLPVS
jgi:hypothetical protein